MYKQKHKIFLLYEDPKILSNFALCLQKYLNFYSFRLKELGIIPILLSKNIDLTNISPNSKIILLNESNNSKEQHLQIIKDLTEFYKPLISFPTYQINYYTGEIIETTVYYLDPNTIQEYLYGNQDCNKLLRNYCEYLEDKYNKTEEQINLLQEKLKNLIKELPKIDSLLSTLKQN